MVPLGVATWKMRPLYALLFVTLASCEAPPNADQTVGTWQGTTVQEGSVLTVRTTGGSVWGGDGRLIEETAIGTETRGESDLLGDVYGIEATADRIFIADRVFTMIRVFDMNGGHVMNIGRRGGGPGEFRSVTDLGIDTRRGYLTVREGSGILHRFATSGEYVDRIVPRGLQGSIFGASLLLRVTRDGKTILPHFSYRSTPGTELGYISTTTLHTVDSTGLIVDSLPLPDYGIEPFILQAWVNREAYRPQPVPFGPQEIWSIGWDGALITGHSSRYRFEIRYNDGRRTIVERDAEPVRVQSREKAWATEQTWGIMRHFNPDWTWHGPAIPDTKPWYAAIIPDRSGRLWVLREGVGRPVDGWTRPEGWKDWERNPAWVPERWFEVFEEATGHYLGRVDVPDGFASEPEPVIEDDTFICLTSDELGRPIVRRYRLDLPAHQAR